MRIDIFFVESFYRKLNEQKIKYCILRNADEVERGDAHDVDMTVDVRFLKKTNDILMLVAKEQGWKLHLKTGSSKDKYNIKCYHFFKTVNDGGRESSIYIVHFDIFPTFTWNGYIMLNNDVLLHRVDETRVYHKAAPEIEAVTKLFIRLLHNGYIKSKYKEYIKTIFNVDTDAVRDVLNKFLSVEMTEQILNYVKEGKWKELEEDREKLVNDIKKYSKRNFFGQKRYLIEKAVNKAGIMIVFEGTDGSGKSTIINALPDVIGNSFPEGMQDYYHWRPGFIKREKREEGGQAVVVTEPHAKKPYGKVKSFAKFMFFNLDYILGYWFKIRWQIAKGHLVIFDRYYYDYYLDKLRYRLTISNMVLDIFKCMIPKPDITFLLIGDPKILYERKKEISVDEIKKQIDSLLRNKNNFSNPIIIDVNNTVETVVTEVSNYILQTCAGKIKE